MDWIHSLEGVSPVLLYLGIGLLAAIENILPVVPADTVVVLGAFLAARGILSGWAVFAITWSANVGVATWLYALARRHGPAFFASPLGRRLIPESAMQRLERMYQRHGTYGIFLSRLLPGWRAVVPPFAGVVGLPAARALVPMALASALWYGGLTYAVFRLGTNFETVLARVEHTNRAFGALAVVLVALAVGALVWRRRRP